MTTEGTDGKGQQGELQGSGSTAIPKEKYDGVLRKMGEKDTEIQTLTGKVQTLEEQLKTAPSMEEFNRIKADLEAKTQEIETVKGELGKVTTQTADSLRASLVGKGIAEDKVKDLPLAELQRLADVIGSIPGGLPGAKPRPDLGIGGGSGSLQGSPMDLARQGYSMKK